MKRVLHISKYYYPFVGGIEQTAKDCVDALGEKFEQKVICFNHERGMRVDYVDNVEVIRCACQVKIQSQSISLGMRKRLSGVINDFNPDVILFHYPNPFAAQWLLSLIKKEMELIVYWHLDITKQKILGKAFHFQNLYLIRRADKIIATSQNYLEGSKYLCGVRDKCVVVPSCINEERLRINSNVISTTMKIKEANKGKVICLAVGRHVPYKGFEYLVEASKKLDNSFSVFILGSGELTKKLQALADGDSKVHFLGSVDDETLKAYYCATDIFCFPSVTKNEAFGLALVEAMFFENPSVTFTIPESGVNYVSLNNETGIEVENGSIDQYAAAMKRLAEDKKLHGKMKIAAKRRVESNFLYIQYKENILSVFSS